MTTGRQGGEHRGCEDASASHHQLPVGPGGPGFDTKSANPCAKAGKGVLQENPSAAQKTALHAAIVAAGRGLATANLATAQAAAKETADSISTVN